MIPRDSSVKVVSPAATYVHVYVSPIMGYSDTIQGTSSCMLTVFNTH